MLTITITSILMIVILSVTLISFSPNIIAQEEERRMKNMLILQKTNMQKIMMKNTLKIMHSK